jgi:hypothetical protein
VKDGRRFEIMTVVQVFLFGDPFESEESAPLAVRHGVFVSITGSIDTAGAGLLELGDDQHRR